MLLDRRRVKFWQKWVFLFMAIIMGGFLVMIPISGNLSCGGASSATEEVDKEIAQYKAAVAATPKDTDAWRSLAESYVTHAGVLASEAARNNEQVDTAAQAADYQNAVAAYRKAEKLLAKQKGADARDERLQTLNDLVSVYLYLQDYQRATSVYGQITTLTPKDAQAYFEMATVAIHAGDTNTALLAFTKFLELDPESPDAADVKEWINQNAPSPAPTKGSSE